MNENETTQQEFLFLQLVSMFQVAAMQQLGKIPSPLSGKIERDLEQAKMSIDILSMIKEKTSGNLSRREGDFLGKVLFECQMNYLDELKRPESPAGREPRDEEKPSPGGGKGAPEPGPGGEGPETGGEGATEKDRE